MELKVDEPILLPIKFNFDELKAELQAKTKDYSLAVYTEDKVKEAKSDRANLNKLKKALNDERIRLKNDYLEPYNKFEKQIKELTSIIDEPIAIIDKQIKGFEEDRKEEKLHEIEELFLEQKNLPEWLSLDKIFDSKWLNASVSMTKIQEEIREKLKNINSDVKTINNLSDYAFESLEHYKEHLNLNSAIAEGQRIEEMMRRKREIQEAERLERERLASLKEKEKEKPAPTEEPKEKPKEEPENNVEVKSWVGFKALLSVEDAKKLGQFLVENNIQIEKLAI